MSSAEVISPAQLLRALELQSHAPVARIGEALVSLGMVSDEQLRAGLSRQRREPQVPLGEMLVRMGVVSRAQLQIALLRKPSYYLRFLSSKNNAAGILWCVEVDRFRTIVCVTSERSFKTLGTCFAGRNQDGPSLRIGEQIFYRSPERREDQNFVTGIHH